MRILSLIIAPIFLFAGEYYSKVEPVKSFVITSKVSGKVISVNDSLEGKIAGDSVVVKIDDEVAKINYEVAKTTYEIRKDQYNRVKNLSTRSKTEKDNEKISYLNAKQNFINAKDNYFSRSLRAEGLYIQDVKVEKGGYVNPGTALVEAYDVSKSKLTVFVTRDDIENIENKKILVEGKEGTYKLDKYSSIADTTYVSSFKVELIGEAPKRFSDVVKVEIK